MADNHSLFSLYGKSPLYQLFVSLLIILSVGIILLSVLLLAGIQIFNADLGILEISSTEVSGRDIGFIRYLLISQGISLFIVPAIIILNISKPGNQACLMELKMLRLNEIVLVIVLAFCIFPITGFTGQLNSGMDLPDWLSGVEQWMIAKEESANSLIDLVIESDTFWVMILNVLIIAVFRQ